MVRADGGHAQARPWLCQRGHDAGTGHALVEDRDQVTGSEDAWKERVLTRKEGENLLTLLSSR